MTNEATPQGPIVGCIDNWHAHLRGQLDGGLDAILHPDCVFLSPVVFTPQVGRDITKAYLTAAAGTLGGESNDAAGSSAGGEFGYTTTILQGHHAMLEFETSVGGKYANGVDIITCDDDGLITEFKVMMRPLQAINAVHEAMAAMLAMLAKMAEDAPA